MPFSFKEILQAKKAMILYLGLSFVVILIGVFSHLSNKNSYEKLSREQLKVISEAKAVQISEWYGRRIAEAKFVYTAQNISYTVESYNENKSSKEYAERINLWLKSFADYYNYKCVTLFGVDSRPLFCSKGKCFEDVNYSKIVSLSIKQNRVVTSGDDLEVQIFDGLIDIAVPLTVINRGKRKNVGAILLKVDPENTLFPLVSSWPVKSDSGDIVLIDVKGETARFLNKRRFQNNIPSERVFKKGEKNIPIGIHSALNSLNGFVEGPDYRGEAVLGYSMKIKDTNWWLYAKVDKKEYLTPVKTHLLNTIVIVLLFLGFLLLVFYLVYFKEKLVIIEQKAELESRRNKLLKDEQYFAKYTNDAIILTDFAGNIMDVNEGAVEMTGYPREELLTMNAQMLRPNELRGAFVKMVERIIEAGRFLSESAYMHKKGKIFPIESNAKVVTLDGKKFIQGVVRDITERKNSEALQKVEQVKYKELFDNMIECVAVYRTPDNGENFVFVDMNKSAETLEKVKKSEILGRNVKDVFPGVEEFGLLKVFREVWNTGIMIFHPLSIYKDSRLSGWRENYVYKLPTGEIVAIYSDVTGKKQAEEAIKDLNANLEKRVLERTAQLAAVNKELETFAYSVSHDLRTPLRGIDGWSQAIYEDFGDRIDNKGREYLNFIRKDAQRMGNLIDDLLKLSRMSRLEMKETDVYLSKIAVEISESLRKTNPKRVLEFVIEPALTAFCDPGLLEIALNNLFENSVKFTGPKPKAIIEFGREKNKENGAFFVKDNGVGFDMTFSDKLFGAFQRMHRQSEFPGTGIGLATVQRIMNRHGGKIWAESEVGVGTTIYFKLK